MSETLAPTPRALQPVAFSTADGVVVRVLLVTQPPFPDLLRLEIDAGAHCSKLDLRGGDLDQLRDLLDAGRAALAGSAGR